MKKITSLVLVLCMLFALAACAEAAPAPTAAPEENEEFTFIFNGMEINFETPISEIEGSLGKEWRLSESEKCYSIYEKGRELLEIYFVPGKTPKLESITFESGIVDMNDGIICLKSTADDLKAVYGEPDDAEEYGSLAYYYYDLDEDVELYFCVVDGLVRNATISKPSRSDAVDNVLEVIMK